MAQQVTNYVCPNCGGPLRFDGKLGRLKCDYCESTFTVEEVQKIYAAKNEKAEEAGIAAQQEDHHTVTGADFYTEADINVDQAHTDIPGGDSAAAYAQPSHHQAAHHQAAAGTALEAEPENPAGVWGKDEANIRTYSCTTCGAELICDATTAAVSCPYCGNPTIIPAQFSGVQRPDYVIPFVFEKNEAIEKLKGYYKGKKLLPRSFLSSNHLEEIKGVYVPFWLFNGTVDGEMRFEGLRSQITREGDWQVTRTQHFDVQRAATLQFDKIPVDASSRMSDALMDSIEPFDYNALRPFALEYLPGFLANKYDVEIKDCEERAQQRAVNSAVQAIQNTVTNYDSVRETGRNMRINPERTEYALMPVWLLHTKWNNKDFMFAMNGQTARMIGDLPVSTGKLWGYILGIGAIVAMLLFMMLGMDTQSDALLISIIAGLAVGGVSGGIMYGQMKPVSRNTTATGYMDRTRSDLRLRNDIYLRTTEQRIPIQQMQGGTRPPGGGSRPGRR